MKLLCFLLVSLTAVFAEENPDFTKKIVYEGIEDPSPAVLEVNPIFNALYETS